MRVAVKRSGSALEIMTTAQRYRADAAVEILGKHIDQRPIWLDEARTLSFICDDLGPMRHLPGNFLIEVPNPFAPIQMIMGDVLFVRTKPITPMIDEIWDYEVESLTDTDLRDIQELLSDDNQITLAMMHFAQGG